jgi:hypothetical protein
MSSRLSDYKYACISASLIRATCTAHLFLLLLLLLLRDTITLIIFIEV